jgi:hypothetical protein
MSTKRWSRTLARLDAGVDRPKQVVRDAVRTWEPHGEDN